MISLKKKKKRQTKKWEEPRKREQREISMDWSGNLRLNKYAPFLIDDGC